MGIGDERKESNEQSPEILGRSTTRSCVAGGIVHVQRRRPQRRGEGSGHVAGSAAAPTGAASDGGVKGVVLEAAAVGGGSQGRRGGGGRGGRRLGRGHELRFHRLS